MISFIKKNIPVYCIYILKVYFLGIILFTLFRILLLAVCFGMKGHATTGMLLTSFVYGWRFDTCISGYILSFPFLVLIIASIFRSLRNYLYKIIFFFIAAFYCTAFFICAADVPYFKQFSSRLTTSVLLWTGSPLFMLKMIFAELSFWIYLVPFILVCYFFIRKLRIIHEILFTQQEKFAFGKIISTIIFAGLIFLGIRGRIDEKSPIRIGTAYFSDNSFANQLGLNPVFTFLRSWLDDQSPENDQLKLMDEKTAIAFVRKSFGATDADSPVLRKIISDSAVQKTNPLKLSGQNFNEMNVVIVIMESMSKYFMGEYGGPKLTPELDSIAKRSYSFENIYTSGIHTFNGIYSTLFSYPALMHQHPMNKIPSRKFYGISSVLKEKNYATIFFTTHDGQFDNAEGFLHANDFDEIISKEDYPSNKSLSTLGVPDDFMFEFSIPVLNEINKSGEKFLCAFMTASNHKPFVLPENIPFHPKSTSEDEKMVEYADWSVGKFLKLASLQPWYKNTIFVFVADHGCDLSGTYDMPLSYHHSPLIIHSPELIPQPETFDCLGGQMDIFPTLMGLMNIAYENNTMGIDLLKEKRPFIYFTADDKIGCLDKEYFFLRKNDGSESLYHYQNASTENILEKYEAKADSMKNYAYSMLQTTQWMISNEKFGKPEFKK